ncbi:transmembrane and coiled-coil domains protein 1-like isoform X4 [Pomacea canaliculata]|uniref:transmembrane and coiled-coil domains protein 1-like isoform X4 n=1 Tax=Pomacea canaliculata TaxID=400727 RepID=UPI000D7272DE|nr:transmembrane and coiled-coil domains protein 1-like isoform X4 [Pomacea canaliculata]
MTLNMKKTVDDLDAWYRQHIQRTRKYSAPALPMSSRSSESHISSFWESRDDKGQHLTVPERYYGQVSQSPDRTPSPTRKVRARKSLPEGSLALPGHGEELRRKSYDLAAEGGKSSRLGLLLNRLNPAAMKKTEAAKAAAGAGLQATGLPSSGSSSSTKVFKKSASKSPNLPRKPGISTAETLGSGSGGDPAAFCPVTGTSGSVNRAYTGSGTLHPPASGDDSSSVTVSIEDLDSVDGGSSRENGTTSLSAATIVPTDENTIEAQGPEGSDAQKQRQAIEHLQAKINKTKELIRREQTQKESNVNEYLQLASAADKQQSQRMKNLFEKRNQKSAQSINHLQKKLEQYQRRLQEVETHGFSTHKQAKEVLRDVGQGLKGVVDNIKGARDTIVSKPKEFAHLIKNKFGSADNITHMTETDESNVETEPRQQAGGAVTLPANFRYGSDEDNSSVTSGSGYGAGHSSPHSASQNASQSLPVPQAIVEPLYDQLSGLKVTFQSLDDTLKRLTEEFENYKATTQSELGLLRSLLEEEKFRVERLEEQVNDLTELHQNEMANLKQDTASVEEKIEYRLEERTTDLSDLVDNCQTRILRLEQQQQQQQLLSMEMVENVTFRTILTKLINVVLAVLAVILVFVSTGANLLSPFLTTRMRILSTSVMLFSIAVMWNYGGMFWAFCINIWDNVSSILPGR